MKKPKIGTRTGGFTLVELMVVIAIIAALTSLGFVVTAKVMSNSRLTASTNQVRNLGVMIQGYTQDNAGQLPVWKDQSQDLYWWGALVKDPKNTNNTTQFEIFRSPGHKEFKITSSAPNVSYGWNANVVGRYETSEGGDGPKRMASFREPSRILVLADGAKTGGDGLIDQNVLPDPERYRGKAAGLLLDGSGRQFSIEGDFKKDGVWFLTEEEREARGQ